MLFQRKTDVAEKAMTWLQEAIDCYRILQMACKEINGIYNPVTWNKLQMSLLQANQLYRDTSRRLYSIYLYYDFSEIEIKHNCLESNYNMNYAFTELGRLEQQVSDLREKGYDDNSQEIMALKKKALSLFEKLAQAIDVQINTIVDMQELLKKDYHIELKHSCSLSVSFL